MRQINKIKQYILILLLLTALPCSFQAEQTDFDVYINTPSNQIDPKATYFDLQIEPKLSQTLEVVIQNKSNVPLKMIATLTNARTTMNGLIDYSPHNEPKDSSLKYAITDVMTLLESKLEIPVSEAKTFKLNVRIPDDVPMGVILGGIDIRKQSEENKVTDQIHIGNEYAMIKGIKLSYGTIPSSDFKIEAAKAENFKRQPVISVTIKHPTAVLATNMTMHTEINKKGNTNILQTTNKTKIEMAPSSQGKLPIVWEGSRIPPGTYEILVTLTHKEQRWQEKLEFTVSAKDASDTKSTVIDTTPKPASSLPIYLIIGLLLFIIIVLLCFILRQQQRKKM